MLLASSNRSRQNWRFGQRFGVLSPIVDLRCPEAVCGSGIDLCKAQLRTLVSVESKFLSTHSQHSAFGVVYLAVAKGTLPSTVIDTRSAVLALAAKYSVNIRSTVSLSVRCQFRSGHDSPSKRLAVGAKGGHHVSMRHLTTTMLVRKNNGLLSARNPLRCCPPRPKATDRDGTTSFAEAKPQRSTCLRNELQRN